MQIMRLKRWITYSNCCKFARDAGIAMTVDDLEDFIEDQCLFKAQDKQDISEEL